MPRLDVALIAVAVAGFACTVGGIRLPPGAVEAADREMPLWTKDPRGKACPPARLCVAGTATGTATLAEAQQGARYNAYLQLAERAFPVQVVQKYRGERHNDEQSVTEETRTELLGRLKGAEILHEFWVRRHVYNVQGVKDAYDGHALVAIDPARLPTLYEDEMRRTREEARTLLASLGRAGAALTGPAVQAADVASAVAACQDAGRRLSGLQDCPEKTEVAGALDVLARRADGLMQIELAAVAPRPGARVLLASLSVRTSGVPLAGFPLLIGVEGRDDGVREVRTDPSGVAQTDIPLASRLAPCTLRVSLPGIPSVVRALPVPAQADCVRLRWAIDTSGFLGDEIRTALYRRTTEIEAGVGSRARTCGPDAGARALDVTVTLASSLNQPAALGQGVRMAGGRARIRVDATIGPEGALSRTFPDESIKGMGLDSGQIRAGVEERLVGLLRRAVEAVLGEI